VVTVKSGNKVVVRTISQERKRLRNVADLYCERDAITDIVLLGTAHLLNSRTSVTAILQIRCYYSYNIQREKNGLRTTQINDFNKDMTTILYAARSWDCPRGWKASVVHVSFIFDTLDDPRDRHGLSTGVSTSLLTTHSDSGRSKGCGRVLTKFSACKTTALSQMVKWSTTKNS